jgi:integrase
VKEFCNNANWSDATQKNYKYALLNYARFLFPDSKEPLKELDKRVRSKIDPAKNIAAYAVHMKGKPPKTVGLYMTAVRSFYGINGHVFNKHEMKRIIPKTGDAETKKGEMTTEILRKMVGAADIRGRVMIMLFASTSCRIGELCATTLEMVDMTTNPPCIRLPKEITKNKRPRTVFLTDECKEVVTIWLRSERMKYLTASYNRNEGLNDQFKDMDRVLPEQDRRLLGLSTSTARGIWYTTLSRVLDKKELKPDTKTRVHPLSPHIVRNWWRVHANIGFGGNEDYCHLIMGHWNNQLDIVYAKIGDAGLGKAFLKAQSSLSILSGETVKGLEEKQERQADRMLALERENKALKEKLDARLDDIEAKYAKAAELDKKMAELEALFSKVKSAKS